MTQSPNPPPNYTPLNKEDIRRILDSKLVNTGLPGAIAGFGISRAFEGEWWQFASLAGIAVGVWVLVKLGDRLASRVEHVFEHADRAFDHQLDRTLTTLSQFHYRYLEALKTYCHNLNVEGFRGYLPRLALEHVYVPLRVNAGAPQAATLPQSNLNIWDLLPKADHPDHHFPYRLLAIVADPGYGKTTLTRFLTLSFANQTYIKRGAKPLIPILLPFRDIYPRIQSKTTPILHELIVEQVQQLPRCQDLYASGRWFKHQLNDGQCLVMLDGLDEVPDSQRELASRWAHWQMQNYPSQFILTSRPHGYDGGLFEGVQRIDILDFNNDQKRAFIDQWYRYISWELIWKRHWDDSQYDEAAKRLSRQQAEAQSNADAQRAADDLSRQLFADQNLTDLAKNPLLITIIAATHEASESLPNRRIRLYQKIFNLLLEDRPNRRDTRLTLSSAEENQQVVQLLALRMSEQNITQISPRQGASWIQQRLAEHCHEENLTARAFLREIQQISGILAGGEGHLYEFTHKTFQEYLTAFELAQQPSGQDIMLRQISNPDWKEVVAFYAALTDAAPFVEAVLDTPSRDGLKLAQRLVNESKRLSEPLKERLLQARQVLAPESAEVRLEHRFQSLTALDCNIAISEPITWGEYQLFLYDQSERQFHSQAKHHHVSAEQRHQPVTHIGHQDAWWFCAWLSTQTYLAPDDGVYDYRLPTGAEQAQIYSTQDSSDVLRVVRQRISPIYRELVNYLANGRWKEADQETDRLMLKAVGIKAEDRGYLELEEIQQFPWEALELIDNLWIKFSGGRFGFSVQKQIWLDVGGTLDFNEEEESTTAAFEKMSDRIGWKKQGSYINYRDVQFHPDAPVAHLPFRWHSPSPWGWTGFRFLLARIQNCSQPRQADP